MPMKKYILGFLTGVCFLPILDSVIELIQVALEVPKGKLSKEVMKLNNEIQNIQAESEPVGTSCIGFDVPEEVEYYDEDDDE